MLDAPVRELFGIRVAAVTMPDVVRVVDGAIAGRRPLQIGVVNAAKIVNMKRDPRLCEDVLASDIVLADGMAVVWASRLLGRSLPERVAGIDLMYALIDRAAERGYRVFCLGATPDVLAGAVESFRRRRPAVIIAGSHHGYFSAEEEPAVARAIEASRADIVFIAMTSPRKEQFLARWSRQLGVPVWHGVGGSFDVAAGLVQRAPVAWQRLGLEWLYRAKQEPRRLARRYLVTNLLFIGIAAREMLRTRRGQLRTAR
ncbi:MAG TPA: WecB/TagA/CpsF family glycosyltransferase [Vicinamibacterales bacterium]|nr:WecB/TagA/CpsF family glycosyltransferase [Vicinamibacterales bacterium]